MLTRHFPFPATAARFATRPIDVGPSWNHDQNAYTLSHIVPGVAASCVVVQTQDDVLSLDVVASNDASKVLQRYLWRMPDDVMRDEVSAQLQRGVLTITLPRRQPPAPRAITVVEKAD